MTRRLTVKRDHPRSRGEYACATRGVQQVTRIIPALAGNTGLLIPTNASWRDHPRSRGEYQVSTQLRTRIRGSSPLSRGIPGLAERRQNCKGIIPALAGNTDLLRVTLLASGDHPRSRGEYVDGDDVVLGSVGSSPLSRGIPHRIAHKRVIARIIPALAGNTARRKASTRSKTDHPRSRGEYTAAPVASAE